MRGRAPTAIAWISAALLVCALHAVPGARPSIDVPIGRLSAERMRSDVAFLCSPAIAGRLSGEPGSQSAADFVAAAMRNAGLQPAAGAGSYFQQIPLLEFEIDETESTLGWLLQKQPGLSTVFHPPGNFFCRFPKSAETEAGVVFAGYGITAPELHYDDYAGLNARGKFVLALAGEPQRERADSVFNGRGDTLYAGSYSKLRNAAKHGAAGLLLASGRSSARIRASSGKAIEPDVPEQALADEETGIPLVSIASHVADDLLRAAHKQRADLESRIDATLRPQSFELAGIRMTLDHRLLRSRAVSSVNIAASIEGSDPKLKSETVLVCAHYDHLGAAGGHYFPGANDNASGTAAVLELARAFAGSGVRPRRSLLFIVFGSEEEGLLGYFYYVRHPLRPLEETVAVLDLDMIGRDETPGPETDGQWHVPADTANALDPVGTHYSPDLRRAMEAANARVGLKLDFRLDADHSLDIMQRCDHYPFALEHIPAVWLFGGFHPEYHQVTDTPDRLNFTKMLKVTQLTMRLAWELANQEGRPKFILRPGPVKETA